MNSKEAYVEKLSGQLVEYDRQVDTLSYQADMAEVGLKSGYLQQIDCLLRERKVIELKLQKISAASEVTWQEIKDGGDDAWDEIRADLHDSIVNVK